MGNAARRKSRRHKLVLRYFDGQGIPIASPVSAANLQKIQTIQISIIVENTVARNWQKPHRSTSILISVLATDALVITQLPEQIREDAMAARRSYW